MFFVWNVLQASLLLAVVRVIAVGWAAVGSQLSVGCSFEQFYADGTVLYCALLPVRRQTHDTPAARQKGRLKWFLCLAFVVAEPNNVGP
jgi:hypothetical protein